MVYPRFVLGFDTRSMLSSLSYHPKRLDGDVKYLKTYLHLREAFPTSSGRVALYHILKMLKLPKGSKVGVPLYCCTVVFDAIRRAGHLPVFLDINEDTLTVDPNQNENKLRQIDAIVIVHIFGIPTNIRAIQETTKDIPLIEDCAHSPLSRYGDKLCGSLGIASFFSFGLGKAISTGGGGLIGWNGNQPHYSPNITTSKRKPIQKITKSWTATQLSRKHIYGMAKSLRKEYSQHTDVGYSNEFIEQRLDPCFIGLAKRKLEKLPKEVKKWRKSRILIQNALKEDTIEEPKWGTWNSFLFPLRIGTDRDKLALKLFKQGYDCAPMYRDVPRIARESYGYSGDCPVAETACKSNLIIPHRWVTTKSQAEKLAKDIEESRRCKG